MARFSQDVGDLLTRQQGIVTRAQLIRAGVSAETVRWNAGRTWRVLLPQVYLVGRAEPTAYQRLIAGVLWAGPHSALAGPTAARYYGLTQVDPRHRVHVLVPRPQRARTSSFVEVRRTTLHDPGLVTSGVLRICGPARATVEAAATMRRPEDRAAVFVEAVQKQVTTLNDLAEWVLRAPTGQRRSLQAALDVAASGAWSVPEARLLDLMSTSRILPTAMPNPRLTDDTTGLRLLTPDAWFDDVAMAVLVHSHRFHSQGDLWDDTVERDGGLTAVGVVVTGVTPHRIRTQPTAVLDRLERTYAAARRRPRPAVTAHPR